VLKQLHLGRGSVGVVGASAVDEQKRGARTLVATGTVVFAEVLRRTLTDRPLLSARRLFRRLALHRASQVLSHNVHFNL
jgi:small subunit ribosomal protein S1